MHGRQKRHKNNQIIICKPPHRKLTIEQYEPHKQLGLVQVSYSNSGTRRVKHPLMGHEGRDCDNDKRNIFVVICEEEMTSTTWQLGTLCLVTSLLAAKIIRQHSMI